MEPFTLTRTLDAPRDRVWLPHDAGETELKAFDAGRAGMTQGWGGTLEQLTAYLATQQSAGRA